MAVKRRRKKREESFAYALRFCRVNLDVDDEIAMRNPVVSSAIVRYKLSSAEARNLVNLLRKERDGRTL